MDYEALDGHSDATRDIGRAAAQLSTTPLARATSWHGAETEEATASDIAQPGGFRREFVMRPEGYGTVGSLEASSPRGQLAQYASRPLVPELLRVQQGVEADDDLLGLDPRLVSPLLPFYKPMYLLTPAKELGVSDQSQLVVMILKGFLGASVLYLPRSFLNGGLALGALTLAVVCVLAIVCIRQLIDCADRVLIERTISSSRNQQTFMEDGIGPFGMPSYGDLAEVALGKPGRAVVDLSVAASQVGFCATYFVFVSANVAEVIGTLAGCRHVISQGSLCALLALVWLPLAQIRRLKHLSTLNLLADLCIVLGLLLILTGALTHLATTTTIWDLLRWARFEIYPLCLGTALFAFEGIGLVLPMYEGTDPALRKNFKDTLTWTLAILCTFFILFAAVAYLSFGSTTRTVVLFNLRVGGEKRIVSQILFSAALFCTYPLMLQPVSKLVEDRMGWRGSGTAEKGKEAKRDMLRAVLVLITMSVALGSALRLQSLVALVGGLCCAPLALVFPPVLHHKLIGGQWKLDAGLSLLGVMLATVSSVQAAWTWDVYQEIPYYSCSGN